MSTRPLQKAWCGTVPACINSSSTNAAMSTSHTEASTASSVQGSSTASPVPPLTTAVPKQPAQLPSDLNGNTPSQSILGSYPKHLFGFSTILRSFNPAWYRTRPWLENSVEQDTCFSFPCRKYDSTADERDVVFTVTGKQHSIGTRGYRGMCAATTMYMLQPSGLSTRAEISGGTFHSLLVDQTKLEEKKT